MARSMSRMRALSREVTLYLDVVIGEQPVAGFGPPGRWQQSFGFPNPDGFRRHADSLGGSANGMGHDESPRAR
jgi:hypothetical protein